MRQVWKDDVIHGGKAASANGNGKADRRVLELEKEVKERDWVIGELTVTNRILKCRKARFDRHDP